MSSRFYTQILDNISVNTTANQDVFLLSTAAAVPAVLVAFELYSSLTTDERVRLRLMRRSTAGSGGSAATETAADEGDTATIATAVTTIVTTVGTAGAILKGFYWSQLGPLIYRPTPEERIRVAGGSFLALNNQTTLGSARTWSGFIVWGES